MNDTDAYDFSDFSAEKWPLMKSPIYPSLILIFYWCFIYKLGPQLMKNRPALDIDKLVIAYDAYQVIVSGYLFCVLLFGLEDPFQGVVNSICGGLKKSERNHVDQYAWWYFFIKITELLDTIFFVLRKKQSQVTFLHVYHHSIVMAFSWIYTKYLTDGHGLFIAVINSFVHVVMYSYYLISALGPRYQKFTQWKKLVTWLQLSQFGVGVIIVAYMLIAKCHISKGAIWFYVINNFVFGYLFLDFYIKAYHKKPIDKTK